MFCQRLPAELPLGFQTSLPLHVGYCNWMWGPSIAECLEGRPAFSFGCLSVLCLPLLSSYELLGCFFLLSAILRMSRFEPPELGTHLQGKVVVLTGMCIHAIRILCCMQRHPITFTQSSSPQRNQYTNTILHRRRPRHRRRTSPPSTLSGQQCLLRRRINPSRRSPCL